MRSYKCALMPTDVRGEVPQAWDLALVGWAGSVGNKVYATAELEQGENVVI